MLISFEGLPGVGKTTQAKLLADALRADGLPVTYLPDLMTLATDDLGDTLYRLFSSSGDPFKRHGSALTDTFLAAAIRTNIVATLVEPALAAGDIVIEDRGIHTMYSYSLATLLSRHRMDPDHAMTWLNHCGALTGRPADLALRLRTPVDESCSRAAARDGKAPTVEQRLYLEHVDRAYEQLEAHDPSLVGVDTAGRDVQEVAALVHVAVRCRLPEVVSCVSPAHNP